MFLHFPVFGKCLRQNNLASGIMQAFGNLLLSKVPSLPGERVWQNQADTCSASCLKTLLLFFIRLVYWLALKSHVSADVFSADKVLYWNATADFFWTKTCCMFCSSLQTCYN